MSAPSWGNPPWTIALELPYREIPERCEVAVVGGGLAGLSAAYHVARAGVGSVVLLEAHRLGSGASGRTGGIVLEGTATGALEGVSDCLPYLQRLTEEQEIACDLELSGCWELRHEATEPAPSAPYARPASRAGAVGADRPPGEAGCVYPPLCWRDADSFLRAVTKVPGGTADAGALITGLAQACWRAGVVLCESAPVHAIAPGPEVTLAVRGTHLRAGAVVVATNAYAPALLSLPLRLQCALTLAVCTQPLGQDTIREIGLDPPLPFYTQDLPYLWGRPLAGNRLIFGAGLVLAAARELEQVEVRSGDAARLLAQLEARIRGLHPALRKVEVAQRWAGPIAFTDRRTPVLARLPACPNIVVLAGCAGHGIALSVRAGALIADAICENTPLPRWGELPPH